MDAKAIRLWSQEERNKRLRALGEEIRREYGVIGGALEALEAPSMGPLLDESLVLFLETMRVAFPDRSPMEMFEQLIDELGAEVTAEFWLTSVRFMETKELVGRFRDGTADDKLRLRPKLMARGML